MIRQLKKVSKQIVVFTDKYPLLGPILWMLSIQYFIVQAIVAMAWPKPYSWSINYISDLGNTVCGTYDTHYVCSPLYGLMNASFIVFGITIALGAILIYSEFKRTKWSLLGFLLMGLSGLGTIMVGLFPENTIGQLHSLGAFLGLVVGNVSIVVLALALKNVRQVFRVYTFLSGLLCIVAFGLFQSGMYLGIGKGGMERVVSYPFTVWMILFGIYMTAVRFRARAKKSNR